MRDKVNLMKKELEAVFPSDALVTVYLTPIFSGNVWLGTPNKGICCIVICKNKGVMINAKMDAPHSSVTKLLKSKFDSLERVAA